MTKTKVAIYNRYLKTAGGGEKHMGAIAEYLSQQKEFQVDLISHNTVDLAWISDRLHIDLSACNLVVVEDSDYKIVELSQAYDIFINSTYMSMLQPRASLNIMLLFFPHKYRFLNIRTNPIVHYIGKKITKNLTCFSILHTINGVYKPEIIANEHGFWTQKQFQFTSIRAKEHYVTIHTLAIGELDLHSDIESIQINGRNASYEIEACKIQLHLPKNSEPLIVKITLKRTFTPANGDSRKLGLFITNVTYNTNHHARFRNLLLSFSNRFLYLQKHFDFIEHLNAYPIIWSNSKYTQAWLKKLWNRDSIVLYPVIETTDFQTAKEKKNIILSVGRFFAGGHNKKHIPMIHTFRKMYDKGLKNWEYHLCGGTHKEAHHQAYLDEIKALSKGYPIFVHTNIPFAELQQLYSVASIFWHGAGFGEDENQNPHKLEHFGITTVEAMSAGCIPVVIHKAGQKEIVKEGINGFFWENLEELEQKTEHVFQLKSEEIQQIKSNAMKQAKLYNRKLLATTIDNSLKNIEVSKEFTY